MNKLLISLKLKTLSTYLVLGWGLAPFIHFTEKYVFSDWDFLKFLFVICMADTVLGFTKAILKKEVSSRGFAKVFVKLLVYMMALICTHVLVNFTVANKTYAVFSWFDTVVFSAIIVREAISIFENIAIIEPGVVPTRLLQYLKQFDSFTGKEKTDDK